MIFIDTGLFLARYMENDQFHKKSISIWKKLGKNACTTSNHVIDETLTLLARRANYNFSSDRAKEIYNSNQLKIERSTEEDELNALNYFEKYADQKVSFTDCLSFAIMKRLKIKKVASFDKHFELAGFSKF